MFLWSMCIKNSKIIDFLIGKSLGNIRIKSSNVSRQTRSGRQYRKKICLAVAGKGYIGIAMKSSKDVKF